MAKQSPRWPGTWTRRRRRFGGWVERARADRTKGKTGLTSEERAKLAKLRKENSELKRERDLLNKWAAFFAKKSA